MTVQAGIIGLGRWGQVLINAIHEKSEEILGRRGGICT